MDNCLLEFFLKHILCNSKVERIINIMDPECFAEIDILCKNSLKVETDIELSRLYSTFILEFLEDNEEDNDTFNTFSEFYNKLVTCKINPEIILFEKFNCIKIVNEEGETNLSIKRKGGLKFFDYLSVFSEIEEEVDQIIIKENVVYIAI